MGKIIYNKGFEGGIIKQTVAPTITFVSKTSDSITVTFTNNSSAEATISYGLSSPPNQDTVLLATSATSSNIVITGLDSETTYTIFASANGTPENLTESEIVSTDPITTPNPFAIFTDTSGSAGSATPINDLNGILMADLDKGIAYYGTVSHTDLFTGDELSSLIGLTAGQPRNNEKVWHKYYWNGGIHFWRLQTRSQVSWNNIASVGAVYGTGTTISRKGFSGTGTVQNKEVTKNGVTYLVRSMEGSTEDPTGLGTPYHSSEFNLILMNLHAATNSGGYSDSPTDGVTYANWSATANFTNNDFVGWKTNLGDNDFGITGFGRMKYQQESISSNTSNGLIRGGNNLSNTITNTLKNTNFSDSQTAGFSPVFTVKHPSFATYGKTGGFNQNEPDF